MKSINNLQLSQNISVALTPYLKQSLAILQMNLQELSDEINQESVENPFLEVKNYSSNYYYKLDNNLENIAAVESVYQNLIKQINIKFYSNIDKNIAVKILDYLDESGYCRYEPAYLAENIGCDIIKINYILSNLKQLEPTGIFAKNLEESMKLQLKELNSYDAVTDTLVNNLELVAKADINLLTKLCRTGEQNIKKALQKIRSLNPKPLTLLQNVELPTIIPDLILHFPEGDDFTLELNDKILPKLYLLKNYYKTLKSPDKNLAKSDNNFIEEKFKYAGNLIKSIDQRAKSLIKVANYIVNNQREFFKKGVKYLKPLKLKDMAYYLNLHESTISRIVNNKYIITDIGLFELKYFLVRANKDNQTDKFVKNEIKNLIANEKDNILSDVQIMKILNERNIRLAVRTVTKYRKALNIDSSIIRRNKNKINNFLN